MVDPIFKALYTKFIASAVASDVTQTGDLGIGLYVGVGPLEARMPYVIMNLVSDEPISTFADDSIMEASIDFAIYSDSPSPEEVYTIRQHLTEAFDRATLTYDNDSEIGCKRELELLTRFDDCWQYVISYKILRK